jgi:hypothetical protein
LEAIYRDYQSKDVNFYFVYKALAHPQSNGFVQPTTIDERLMHAAKAKESLGTTIPWIVDSMDNKFKHAMGDRPNSEFVIDPQGTIVRMRDWSNADELRKDLAELVGPIDNPTDPRSLNLKVNFMPTEVARGVVERVKRDEQMTAVKVETQTASHPAYVKLRAEVDARLRTNGKGKLYLGFFVDPLYEVHWNNQAGAVVVEVDGRTHNGPIVEAKADADPREFLIDITMNKSVEVKLKYVACDDKETWCQPLTQTFIVSREMDPDAGRPQSGADGRTGRQGPGSMRRPIGNRQRPQFRGGNP